MLFINGKRKKMQTVSNYGVELCKQNIPIRQTLEIYRSAVSYLTEIYGQIWEELAGISESKRCFNAAEHLIHTTKRNQARFDFDIHYPKMPSYLRRAAIRHALGSVSSYESRLELWERTGEKDGKPRLVYGNHAMPVFYRDVMYRESAEGKEEACLKLYDGHDWKWFRVRLKHTDMEYLRKNWSGKKKQKLHLWRKRDIQKRCGHQAHRKGMRISRICAWNTSRLAYDGSGMVLRAPKLQAYPPIFSLAA